MNRGAATDRVLVVLEAQRAAVLSGDVDRLETLAAALERAMGALARHAGTADNLSQVRALAAHNAGLLEAAMRGLSQTRNGMKKASDTPLTTYGRDGRQMATGTGNGRLLSRR